MDDLAARAGLDAARAAACSLPAARSRSWPAIAARRCWQAAGTLPAARHAAPMRRVAERACRAWPRPAEGEDLRRRLRAPSASRLGRHPLASAATSGSRALRFVTAERARPRARPQARPRRRTGHLPPASRHRQRRGVRHPGGRDRRCQRHRSCRPR
ncbi:MAG: hypothetical protein MZW92_25150 [Comamonadaceae bacterium]|nr:hypothetical protein [Comamonadaceae bacterium]